MQRQKTAGFYSGRFCTWFLTLSPYAEVAYKTDQYYDPASERAIKWDDLELSIQWPLQQAPILSAKDANSKPFANADLF